MCICGKCILVTYYVFTQLIRMQYVGLVVSSVIPIDVTVQTAHEYLLNIENS